jgi:hypothetical protein
VWYWIGLKSRTPSRGRLLGTNRSPEVMPAATACVPVGVVAPPDIRVSLMGQPCAATDPAQSDATLISHHARYEQPHNTRQARHL